MAEGGFDDFELKNKNWISEEEEEDQDEDFGVGDERYGMQTSDDLNIGEDNIQKDYERFLIKKKNIDIPDARRMRKSMTENIFDFPLRMKNGEFSKQLSDLRFEKFKTRTAIYFKDKRIARFQNNRLEYLKINRPELNEFKMVLEGARKEFGNSLESTFYDRVEGVRN